MTTDSQPADLFDQLDRGVTSDAQLQEIWTGLTGWSSAVHQDAWEACEDSILGALEPQRALEMRPGGWTVDLANTGVRAVVAAALIGSTMWPLGLDQLPAFILPQVLPLLFDIKRARLTRQERRLLVELRISTTAQQLGWPWPPAALYQRLPAHVQTSISEADFEDFLERLVQVGEADNAGYGEVALRPAGDPAFFRVRVV